MLFVAFYLVFSLTQCKLKFRLQCSHACIRCALDRRVSRGMLLADAPLAQTFEARENSLVLLGIMFFVPKVSLVLDDPMRRENDPVKRGNRDVKPLDFCLCKFS